MEKKDPCTGSNINFLYVLVHIADPILLGLRLVGLVWFGYFLVGRTRRLAYRRIKLFKF